MLILNEGKFFEFVSIGEFRTDNEWIHPSRSIDSYEIVFVLGGTVYLEEKGVKYELKPNEILMLEPYTLHSGFKSSIPPTAFYWFHFRTNMDISGKIYRGSEFYDIKYLLKKLLHISNTPVHTEEASDAAGLLILEELLYQSAAAPDSGLVLANKIAEYVRINITDVSVGKTAEHFGYNPDYIGKLFKKSFKQGLKEYISSEKVKFSKDLLLTTQLSVKEISALTGFGDENLFIKFFKYHEEISPAKFRNKYYNTHMNNK